MSTASQTTPLLPRWLTVAFVIAVLVVIGGGAAIDGVATSPHARRPVHAPPPAAVAGPGHHRHAPRAR